MARCWVPDFVAGSVAKYWNGPVVNPGGFGWGEKFVAEWKRADESVCPTSGTPGAPLGMPASSSENEPTKDRTWPAIDWASL